jgi:D-3-phosphoglycerate dehydrogenase
MRNKEGHMKVLVADPIAQEGIESLNKHTQVDVRLGLETDELVSTIGDYEALVVRSQTQVTAPVIEAGKKLVVIGRAGVGVDNIDVKAATRRGIVVVNAPASNTISAAEHTIALMLSLARHIPQANSLLKSGVWKRSEFTGTEVRSKTLGIVGLGNVGSEVARRARGLQMHIIAHDPFVSTDYAHNLGAELTSVEELLQKSDFITLHIPLTSSTMGMIGAKELATLKPNAYIINCARGGLIDEEALIQAIEEGRVAGAAVDVFLHEPAVDSILCKSDKIIVTPHLGASTVEAQTGVAVDIAEQIVAVLQGQPARYAVNAPLIPTEILTVLAPFLNLCSIEGKLLSQLSEGQMSTIEIRYEGELADYDTAALRATIIGGLLEAVSEERINIVNADLIAKSRGFKVAERKNTTCENYASLITTEVATDIGTYTIAGTLMREEPHIVRINNYWLDIVPTRGYLLFSEHRDRPGLIGAVGAVTGGADVNISSMHVGRLKPRGQALMVLELDESLTEEQRQQILSIPDVYSAKLVKL